MSKRAGKRTKGTSKRKFTPEEDKILIETVAHFGAEKWSYIASFLENRSMRQVRERYVNYLKPNINSSPLKLEDYKLLADLIKDYGNNFSALSKIFIGRTAVFLKNQSVNLDKKIEKLEKRLRLSEKRAVNTIIPRYARYDNAIVEIPPIVSENETTYDEFDIEYDTEIKENEEFIEENDAVGNIYNLQNKEQEESTDIDEIIEAAYPDHIIF